MLNMTQPYDFRMLEDYCLLAMVVIILEQSLSE